MRFRDRPTEPESLLTRLDYGPVAGLAAARKTRDVEEPATLTVNYVGATVVAFSFGTPSGNAPKCNGNRVHLWPVSADSVPFGRVAQTSAAITLDTPDGDQSLTNVAITTGAYLLGYAVGPDAPETAWSAYLNVVASAYIPAAASAGLAKGRRHSAIRTTYVGTNTLVFHYRFLSGFDPQGSGAWVGLWPGQPDTYSELPKWFAPIESGVSEQDAALNGVLLKSASPYTLGLFSSGFDTSAARLDLTRLAARVTFTADT
jgi:hypothetical protein